MIARARAVIALWLLLAAEEMFPREYCLDCTVSLGCAVADVAEHVPGILGGSSC